MSDLTRRGFAAGVAGMAGAPALAAPRPGRSTIDGVKFGAQTYSFHEVPVDGADHTDLVIADMKAAGLTSCELFGPQVEPGIFTGKRPSPADCAKPELGCAPGKGGSARNGFAWIFARKTGPDLIKARAAVRAFRESRPTAYYEAIRRRFDDAGIELYSYNPIIGFPSDSGDVGGTDSEIDGVFYAAKALGVKAINASIRFETLKRLVPFAAKHKMIIAPHGHSVVSDPGEFSTRATFERAFALSPWVWANLDIGHYAATGEDPVAFIRAHHDRITNLHVKDRKKNLSRSEEDGATVLWGQGDTPVGPVLRLLRDKGYKIPAFIEIESIGSTSAVGEVRLGYDYCRRQLLSA